MTGSCSGWVVVQSGSARANLRPQPVPPGLAGLRRLNIIPRKIVIGTNGRQPLIKHIPCGKTTKPMMVRPDQRPGSSSSLHMTRHILSIIGVTGYESDEERNKIRVVKCCLLGRIFSLAQSQLLIYFQCCRTVERHPQATCPSG